MEYRSLKYFNKRFQDLTIDENIELIVRFQKAWLYDDKPELIEKEIIKLKNKASA